MHAQSFPSLVMPSPCTLLACAGSPVKQLRCSSVRVSVRCSESGRAQLANPNKRAEHFSRGLVTPTRLLGPESLSQVRPGRYCAFLSQGSPGLCAAGSRFDHGGIPHLLLM